MKANINPVPPNKKLILHFDVDQVLRIPTNSDKDFYVYELCSEWIWGRLQNNSKQEPEKVTGWKLTSNSLSLESPEQQLVTYKSYLNDYLKPSKQEYEKIMLNLSKGPCAKAKSQIQKNIKNITIPKTLFEAIKELNQPENRLLCSYVKDGKYQILPAFYKMVMTLKKNKRQFAIIIKNNNTKDNHRDIISELNQFFNGEHPLFNGKNGTPAIKMDGSKGTKNFVLEESHQTVYYALGERQYFSTFGTLSLAEEKEPEMFKQKFKSLKSVRMCEGPAEIYSVGHAILGEAACIYEINPLHSIFIDVVDYLTHQIYFTNSQSPNIVTCLGESLTDKKSYFVKVSMFDYLKDIDYFIKNIQALEASRASQISKIEKGQSNSEEPAEQNTGAVQHKNAQSDSQYLKKHLLPVLEGALRQVDLFRPEDPLGYIALYCLKNKDRLE